MSQQNSWLDQAFKAAQDLGETASQASSEAVQFAEGVASDVQKTGHEATSYFNQVVSETMKHPKSPKPKSNLIQLDQVDTETRLAFYGALFAFATADGHLDKEEMELIFGMMDLENMPETAQRQVQSYVITPPSFQTCLQQLSQADERLRYGLMINLVDTAWANAEVDSHEEEAIALAQQEFQVTDEQLEAIEIFIGKMREIRDRGLDDNYAVDAVKTASAGLTAVGVPLAAVWFSGSVLGFSAAGITSGLAALGALAGIGGMVPGIGVAIVAGAGIYMGLNWMLDTGDKRKKAQFQADRERKAQLVIQNMQGAINQLIEQIAGLQEKAENFADSAAQAAENREALRILTERLRFMQQSVAKRKKTTGAA